MSEITDNLKEQLARRSATRSVEKLAEDLKKDWGMDIPSNPVKEQLHTKALPALKKGSIKAAFKMNKANKAKLHANFQIMTKKMNALKAKLKTLQISPERKRQVLADINKKYSKGKR